MISINEIEQGTGQTFFFGVWAFFIRRIAEKQGMGGLMTIGKSKAKVYMKKDVQGAAPWRFLCQQSPRQPARRSRNNV